MDRTPPPTPAGSGSGSGSASFRTPGPGRTFAGRFELLEELGRGGVGVVLRARDLQTGREVALKVLRDSTVNAVVAERLRREGRAAAELEHPGIVRLLASGEKDGLPWLAFELVPGARVLQRAWRGLDLRARAALVRDAARALGHAHARGLVHRDVKPSNVLVDAAGKVRVTDFGIALSDDWERITRSGVMLGTPTHMAPEQIETRRGEVGPWTDVWSLGVLLYQALTGELPFAGDTVLEIGRRVVEARLTPPHGIAPEVPPALERVCLACLMPRPEDRPRDGQALAALLDRALEAEATRAGLARGLRALLAGAGGLGLVLLGVLLARRWDALAPAGVAPPASATAPGEAATASRRDAAWLGSASLAELKAAAAEGMGAAWTQLGRASRAGTFAPPDPAESRRCFERAAALEDGEGMLELVRLLQGEGDLAGARRWLERAHAAGAPARVQLARMLGAGEGGPAEGARARKLLEEAARGGEPEVLRALAEATRRGWGAEPDPAAATALLRRAAEAGDAPAMVELGRALERGQGVARDLPGSAEWYRRAAEAGNAEGKAEWALMLGTGIGVAEDRDAARRWMEDAAAAGDLTGQYVLALYLQSGMGGPADPRRARELLRVAAERGHPRSMLKLGETLLEGRGGPKDEVEGQLWLERAAATGDPEGMRRHGVQLWLRDDATAEDRERGLALLQRACELGHGPAMSFLGVILLGGRDKEAGARWLLRAAEAGEPVGMYELAWRLRSGKDMPQDKAASRRWMQRAAELHHSDAQHELGQTLAVEGDFTGARRWLGQAAEGASGRPESMFALAELLEAGQGGPADPAGAEALYRRAAEEGHGGSLQKLGSLAFSRQDWAAALRYWSAAGRKGQPDAWLGVGLIHMRGLGVPEDAGQAAQAFMECNRLGNTDGAVMLALVVRQGGTGLEAQPAQALELMLRVARETGDVRAARWAGAWLLAEPTRAPEGRSLLLRAAEAGDPEAMERLAEALTKGEGGEPDPDGARRWTERAKELRAREDGE